MPWTPMTARVISGNSFVRSWLVSNAKKNVSPLRVMPSLPGATDKYPWPGSMPSGRVGSACTTGGGVGGVDGTATGAFWQPATARIKMNANLRFTVQIVFLICAGYSSLKERINGFHRGGDNRDSGPDDSLSH